MQSAVSAADARPRVTLVVKPGTEDRLKKKTYFHSGFIFTFTKIQCILGNKHHQYTYAT